jgi:hypothetical protein
MVSHDDNVFGPNHLPIIPKPSQNHAETMPKAPPDLVTIRNPVTSAVPVTQLHGLARFARYDAVTLTR